MASHAHLGRLKFKSQTHMCDFRSKFGIFPAALPCSSGFVQIKNSMHTIKPHNLD